MKTVMVMAEGSRVSLGGMGGDEKRRWRSG